MRQARRSDTPSRFRSSSIHRRRRPGLNSFHVQLPEGFAYQALSPRPHGGASGSSSQVPSGGEVGHAPSRHIACAIGNISAALRQSDGPRPLSTGLALEAPLLVAVSLRSLPACLTCLPSSHPPLTGEILPPLGGSLQQPCSKRGLAIQPTAFVQDSCLMQTRYYCQRRRYKRRVHSDWHESCAYFDDYA